MHGKLPDLRILILPLSQNQSEKDWITLSPDMSNIKKLFQTSYMKRVILAEAILFKFGARVLLLFLPIKSVVKSSGDLKKDPILPDIEYLKTIRWALSKGGRLSHGNNGCLVKSLAGRWMLHRRGIASRLFFGVRLNGDNKPIAHAWLITDSFEVVPAGEGYTVLAGF